MSWTALHGAGIVQRMVSTNHSQNLFSLQSTDTIWGLEAVCSGNSNGTAGGFSSAPSTSYTLRKPDDHVGERWSGCRPPLTFHLQPFPHKHCPAQCLCSDHCCFLLLDSSAEDVVLLAFWDPLLDWWPLSPSGNSDPTSTQSSHEEISE